MTRGSEMPLCVWCVRICQRVSGPVSTCVRVGVRVITWREKSNDNTNVQLDVGPRSEPYVSSFSWLELRQVVRVDTHERSPRSCCTFPLNPTQVSGSHFRTCCVWVLLKNSNEFYMRTHDYVRLHNLIKISIWFLFVHIVVIFSKSLLDWILHVFLWRCGRRFRNRRTFTTRPSLLSTLDHHLLLTRLAVQYVTVQTTSGVTVLGCVAGSTCRVVVFLFLFRCRLLGENLNIGQSQT